MQKKIVFMFSGQGTQYFHMGRKLFQNNENFRKWMIQFDNHSKELIGKSVIDMIYDSTKSMADVFNRILYTNPAILILQYSLMRLLFEFGIKPDYVLGASLGEIVSLAASGAVSFEDGISIAVKLAECVEKKCIEGGMLSILHNQKHYHENPQLYHNTEIAAIDFDAHFVVSGRNEDLKRIKSSLEKSKIAYQVLPVPYAFHSLFIKPSEPAFLDYLRQIPFSSPRIPIISCSHTGIVPEIQYDYINEAIYKPIEFQKTIQLMEREGNYVYLDLGPSGTLANFLKYILSKESKSEAYVILNPFGKDLDNLKKVVESLSEKKR
jgi:trans-AT polyketide synthase, acyltransferase and oxidoreductase domains